MKSFEAFGERAYQSARTAGGAFVEAVAEPATRPADAADHRLEAMARAFCWLILGVAFATRLSPLLDIEGRIFWQYLSEDGYLMQTVARNMALGLGMSTAEGMIPTNGVQPLATFLFSALHWIAGGDRVTAITLVTLLSALVSAAGAYALYRLAQVLLGGMPHADTLALAVSAVWFAGPLTIAHSMNGLETGMYALAMLVATLYYFGRFQRQVAHVRWQQAICLGGLLGIVFLARNDGVFFIAALLSAHLLVGPYDKPRLVGRLGESVVAGVVSILVGLPWLINNYLLFDSVVPISGLSQSLRVELHQNLALIPANLIEISLPFLSIPRSLETRLPVILAALLLVPGLLTAFWLMLGRRDATTRRFMFLTVVFSSALVLYYGLFFGAPHFLPRYLSVVSPFLWFKAAVVIFYGTSASLRNLFYFKVTTGLALSTLLIGTVAFAVFSYRQGTTHMHRQVVEWVSSHVDARRWVGAVQTGTLGFFHDRALNLDGKVNPVALRELTEHGNVFDYLIASPVDYIVDWAGVGRWLEQPHAERLRETFSLELIDDELNLSVMKRKQLTPIN